MQVTVLLVVTDNDDRIGDGSCLKVVDLDKDVSVPSRLQTLVIVTGERKDSHVVITDGIAVYDLRRPVLINVLASSDGNVALDDPRLVLSVLTA